MYETAPDLSQRLIIIVDTISIPLGGDSPRGFIFLFMGHLDTEVLPFFDDLLHTVFYYYDEQGVPDAFVTNDGEIWRCIEQSREQFAMYRSNIYSYSLRERGCYILLIEAKEPFDREVTVKYKTEDSVKLSLKIIDELCRENEPVRWKLYERLL